MNWQSEVRKVLARLPGRFTLPDLYRFIPELHHKFPENHHIHAKMRQVLQDLRDQGDVRFLDNQGSYENLRAREPNLTETLPFRINEKLKRDDLVQLLEMGGTAPLERGMFRRNKGPFKNHLFLFHDEKKNPYGDIIEGDRIRFVGQGRVGDQQLKSFNLYLAEHLQRNFHVHYLVQPKDRPGELVYRGEHVLDGYHPVFRPKEDRTVYEFHLVPTAGQAGSPLNEFGELYGDLLDTSGEPAMEERERTESKTRRVIRDKAFQYQILFNYARKCAVCGDPIERGIRTELQAAHIVPVTERGPDDPRNGISLCIRHHWAFDAGFFTIENDFTISWLGPVKDPHNEIINGAPIRIPREPFPKPHELFLRYHQRRARRLVRLD